jgi:hypothetical protein
MAKMSPLRRRMIEDMTLRNLSRQTQQSYIYAVAKFSGHFNRPPDQLGIEDVRAYSCTLSVRSTPGRTSIKSPARYVSSTASPFVPADHHWQRSGEAPGRFSMTRRSCVSLKRLRGYATASPWQPLMRRACALRKSLASRLPTLPAPIPPSAPAPGPQTDSPARGRWFRGSTAQASGFSEGLTKYRPLKAALLGR